MRVWGDFNGRHRGAWLPSAIGFRIAAPLALLALLTGLASTGFAQRPELFIKSGPVLALDNGFFTNTNVGWSVVGGVRQPLRPVYQPSYFFVDIGGSFLSMSGNDAPVTTSGRVQISNALSSQTFQLGSAAATQLIELRRGSFDAAIGWTQNPVDSLFHSWIRGGGRVGHIHGVFTSAPSPAAQAIINTANPGDRVDVLGDFDKTHTFGGLFLGAGTTMTATAVDTLALGRVFVSFGAEAEFAVDWIDFEGFEDNELATAALLFNMTLSR